MANYLKAEIEIIRFSVDDVITVSGLTDNESGDLGQGEVVFPGKKTTSIFN